MTTQEPHPFLVSEETQRQLAELRHRFVYHPPSDADIAVYAQIRSTAHSVAQMMWSLIPECRESTLAVTHLEEMVFWANAAIARRGLKQRTADAGPAE